jgi:hypothetical protein
MRVRIWWHHGSVDTHVNLIAFEPTPHYIPLPDSPQPYTPFKPPISDIFTNICNPWSPTRTTKELTPVSYRCSRHALVHFAYWIPTTITVTAVETIIIARGAVGGPEKTVTRNHTEDLTAMASKLVPKIQRTSMGDYSALTTVDLVFGTESKIWPPGSDALTYTSTMYVLSPEAFLFPFFLRSYECLNFTPCGLHVFDPI